MITFVNVYKNHVCSENALESRWYELIFEVLAREFMKKTHSQKTLKCKNSNKNLKKEKYFEFE